MKSKMLLERWEGVRAGTRRIASGIPEGREDFRPAPGTMTLGELVLHIVSAEKTAVDALTVTPGKWEWHTGIDPEHYPKVPDILGILDRQTEITRQYLAGLKETELTAKVKLPWGAEPDLAGLWHEWMLHEVHHRGNLVTALRVAGVTPPNIWE